MIQKLAMYPRDLESPMQRPSLVLSITANAQLVMQHILHKQIGTHTLQDARWFL